MMNFGRANPRLQFISFYFLKFKFLFNFYKHQISDCYGSGLSSVSYGGGFDVLDQNYGSSAGISYDVNQPVYNHQENSIKTENEQVSYGGDNGYNIKYEQYQTTNQQSNNLTYKTGKLSKK